MKKFSFLLFGVILLGTIAFALADENKGANTLTGSMADMPSNSINSIDTTINTTTGDTAETTTGDTAESTESTEANTTEVATGDTAQTTEKNATETTEENTTETTTGDTSESTDEAETGDNAEPTNNKSTVVIPDSAKAKYDEEQIAAYEWAFNNGITTIGNIEDARLTDGLTRAELAKMMSQYLTKILKGTPAIGEVEYSDVDESLGDLVEYIKIAYAYKIMGVNADGTPLEEFNPNGIVTRADFATVFSRVLYGDNYNTYEGNYYDGHLAALKRVGILTNTTPTIQEMRGWVMLMMYRSTNPTAENENTEEGSNDSTQIANPAAEYCVAQGGTINIVKDEEGNESGMCKLADGTEVDEWEYYRANNTENETGTVAEEPANQENVETGTGEVSTESTLTVTITPNNGTK